jgi:hypothetical protein
MPVWMKALFLVVIVVAAASFVWICGVLGAVIGSSLRRLVKKLLAARSAHAPGEDPETSGRTTERRECDLRIEEYRQRFGLAPLGIWAGALGTFSAVMDEVWRFCPDGTGTYQAYGPFGHPSGDERRFEWKGCEERTISIRGFGQDPDGWVAVRYDFRAVGTDAGVIVAMVEVDESGKAHDGFGMSLENVMAQPLSYVGPGDTESRSNAHSL